MMNRDIEDIDKLFREGLNPADVQFAFQEEDWKKLQHRLDQNEKKKRGVFWLIRLSGVAALILLFLAVRMLLPESPKLFIQQAEVQENSQKQKEKQSQPVTSPEEKKTSGKVEPTSGILLAQSKPAKRQPSEKQLIDSSLETGKIAIDTIQVETMSTPPITEASKVSPQEQITHTTEKEKSSDKKRSSTEESLFAQNERTNELPEVEHQRRKLILSVLAAPAYNGVNSLNNASMGNDFGLLLTLKVSKNWSLSTGGVYAKKVYDTGFGNYNPTKNIWDEYYPKSVNADCRVLDIPLNINYTMLARKNTTISIGSGISSYIMLREDYRFTYTEQDSNTAMAYHVTNENQHWLSVLNLQATFEQRLNSKLSVGVQPYMKIPLSNIGFAGVKLQSLGMAVILNWNFN